MSTLKDRGTTNRGTERRVFAAKLEVRAKPNGTGGTRYELDGYASAYEQPYQMYDMFGDYEEVVRKGSGSKTLSENPDVVLVFNHAGMPMARTKAGNLTLSEDDHGLFMNAPLLNGDQSIVRDVVAGVEDKTLDEMSFGFRVTKQAWSPDWMQRDITEYSLHRGDVSVVTYGANPATSVALRAEDFNQFLSTLEGDALRQAHSRLAARLKPEATKDVRLLAQRAAAQEDITSALTRVLGYFTAIDLIADNAQDEISEILGIPDPDDDDMGEPDAPLTTKAATAALVKRRTLPHEYALERALLAVAP